MAPVLVVFHMNGCPHCPPALEACDGVRGASLVTVEAGHPLVRELGISSFPTIWLSSPAAAFEYKSGPRSTEGIQKWVDSKL